MKQVNYKKLTHQLEGEIDKALRMLENLSHPEVFRVKKRLIDALRDTEEEIMSGGNNVLSFPEVKVVE